MWRKARSSPPTTEPRSSPPTVPPTIARCGLAIFFISSRDVPKRCLTRRRRRLSATWSEGNVRTGPCRTAFRRTGWRSTYRGRLATGSALFPPRTTRHSQSRSRISSESEKGAGRTFGKTRNALAKGLEFPLKSPDGLLWIDPANPAFPLRLHRHYLQDGRTLFLFGSSVGSLFGDGGNGRCNWQRRILCRLYEASRESEADPPEVLDRRGRHVSCRNRRLQPDRCVGFSVCRLFRPRHG